MGALAQFRQDLAWVGWPLRLAVGLLAALLVFMASLSWSIPGLGAAERLAYDMRASATAPVAEQDSRIALIVYDEQTLIETRERSPLDRTILARALPAIDAAGPASIGIDIMFDQPQDDDELLLAALRDLKTPTFLGYASMQGSTVYIGYQQQQFLEEFIGRAGAKVRPGSVGLGFDADGAIRDWPRLKAGEPPPLTAAMATSAGSACGFADYTGPVAFREPTSPDEPLFSKYAIGLFADPEIAPILSDQLKGRHVLIGSDLTGIDQMSIPSTSGTRSVPGLEVQAHMLAQALDGRRLEPFPPLGNLALTVLALVAGVAVALGLRRAWQAGVAVAVLIVAGFALAWWLQLTLGDTRNLGVVGWSFALIGAVALAATVRRAARWEKGRTATLALHRYLPPDIAESIVTRPDRLGLQGETRDVFVMFTDLEGFTNLCQSVSAETVAEFLNEYLEALSQVVLAHGGTIDKFVGDALVAFWGAPVAHDDDAERAVRSAIAILAKSEEFRGRDIGGDIPVGRTRIGLHYGSAIVGNFGGEGRLQYTALGDTMNVAARLEGANKDLGSSILLSGEAYLQLQGTIPCRSMGRIHVRGRSKPVEIFEPATSFDAEELASLNAFMAAALRGDADALDAMRNWVESHPEDAAMREIVRRMQDPAP